MKNIICSHTTDFLNVSYTTFFNFVFQKDYEGINDKYISWILPRIKPCGSPRPSGPIGQEEPVM